jgi:hypothetical protein
LTGELEGKKPLARPNCRWKGNIRIYLKEKGWEVVELRVQ